MTTSKSSTKLYTTELVVSINPYSDICDFIISESPHVAGLFDHNFDWRNFDFIDYARRNWVWVCRRDGAVVGLMMARTYTSLFDQSKRILMQDLLYTKKSSSKAAYLLMKEFVAFGRAHTNLVFTMLTKHTNVKGRSLEKLGFKKTEELYRLEVLSGEQRGERSDPAGR